MAADDILESGYFNDITLIVPLPLSKKKLRKRGYNQCDYIARGISEKTGIPVATGLIKRTKANETQTHKTRDERWENVEGIFTVIKPEELEKQHILLVDDILTTGATLCSCANAIKSSCDCKVSILTLALTYNGI
jgi:ComF family protein